MSTTENFFGGTPTYRTAKEVLDKNGGLSKKIGGDTWLEHREDGIAIRLDDTDIITIYPSNVYALDSGGRQTQLTKSRLEAYLPVNLVTRNGYWIFTDGGKDLGRFEDGVLVDIEGNPMMVDDMEKMVAFLMDKKNPLDARIGVLDLIKEDDAVLPEEKNRIFKELFLKSRASLRSYALKAITDKAWLKGMFKKLDEKEQLAVLKRLQNDSRFLEEVLLDEDIPSNVRRNALQVTPERESTLRIMEDIFLNSKNDPQFRVDALESYYMALDGVKLPNKFTVDLLDDPVLAHVAIYKTPRGHPGLVKIIENEEMDTFIRPDAFKRYFHDEKKLSEDDKKLVEDIAADEAESGYLRKLAVKLVTDQELLKQIFQNADPELAEQALTGIKDPEFLRDVALNEAYPVSSPIFVVSVNVLSQLAWDYKIKKDVIEEIADKRDSSLVEDYLESFRIRDIEDQDELKEIAVHQPDYRYIVWNKIDDEDWKRKVSEREDKRGFLTDDYKVTKQEKSLKVQQHKRQLLRLLLSLAR